MSEKRNNSDQPPPTTSRRVGIEVHKNSLTIAGRGPGKLGVLEDLVNSNPPGTTLAKFLEKAENNSASKKPA